MSVFVPSLRVSLEKWCEWTQSPWDKVRSVVGDGFRCCGPRENVYTMAANAVLALIRDYDVDPGSVGQLVLGTETSTDNSAGAVIVRGMVDGALEQLGLPRLARACEVPEFKHACLGGVYGLKSAARYVAADGAGKRAIVVCSDIAEYERGSTGEQTQGAGAVALLIEDNARLFALDLAHAGSASAYRGPDFRKPHRRFLVEGYAGETNKLHDFPIFSGKYSTFAYLDETVHAVREMAHRMNRGVGEVFAEADAVFFHRPYQHMPVQAMALLFVESLLDADPPDPVLEAICHDAGISVAALHSERKQTLDLFSRVLDGRAEEDPFPSTSKAAAQARRSDAFKEFVRQKMSLGSAGARQLGNLYTGALFAWMAAGLSEAAGSGRELSGASWLAIGYGSGDAAESIPVRVADDWKGAASRIRFDEALAGARDLTQSEYEGLHDGRAPTSVADEPKRGFRIARIGDTATPSYQDLGVEYYEFVE